MSGVNQFFKGVVKAATEITGADFSKLGAAFKETTLNGVEMAQQAVLKGRASEAKDIINLAQKNIGKFDDGTQKLIKEGLEDGVNRTRLTEIADTISKSKVDLDDEVYKKAVKTYADNSGKFSKAMENGASISDINGYLGKEGDKLSMATKASGFFGDETYGTTRKVVAGAGVAGGALAVRRLSGGTLTHNANGERDIAGIPLI